MKEVVTKGAKIIVRSFKPSQPTCLYILFLANSKEMWTSMIMSSLFIAGLYAAYQFLYQVPEIDWQEFRTKYLGTDSVGKIEVINKNLVYIYPKVS